MKIHLSVLMVVLALPAAAVELRWPEATLRGFPVLLDTHGQLLGNGSLAQWIEHGDLHVKAVYEFRDGRRVEEQAVLRQQPELEQLGWSFIERRGDELLRRFEADFASRSAKAQKKEDGELKHWEESLEIEPGKTFAGIGFMYALKNLGDQLNHGAKVELRAVVFTPSPRTATVTVQNEGVETLTFGSRRLQADRLLVHPEIPAVARLFVKAPDQHLWFYHAPPPTLLRALIPLAEPSDPIIRIEVPLAASVAEARAAPRAAHRTSAAQQENDQRK